MKTKFCVGEEVKFRDLKNRIHKAKITKIIELSSKLLYDITLENGGVYSTVYEEHLEKIIETGKVTALDILKDKSGGQMAVSISAVQKILEKLSSYSKKIKELNDVIKSLRNSNDNLSHLNEKRDETIDKLRQEIKELKEMRYTIPMLSLVTDIDIEEF
jgi:peptidoglycan hydrolase CwlO-like protein